MYVHPIAQRARELAANLPAPGRREHLPATRITGWVEIDAEPARFVEVVDRPRGEITFSEGVDRAVSERVEAALAPLRRSGIGIPYTDRPIEEGGDA